MLHMGVDIICLPLLNLPSVSFSLLKVSLTQWLDHILVDLYAVTSQFIHLCLFSSHLCFMVHILFQKECWISKEIRIFTPKNTQHLQIAVETYFFNILSVSSVWWDTKWCSVLPWETIILRGKISWRRCIYIFLSVYLFRISTHYRTKFIDGGIRSSLCIQLYFLIQNAKDSAEVH